MKLFGRRPQYVFDQREGNSTANRKAALIVLATVVLSGAWMYFKFYKPVQDQKRRKLELLEKGEQTTTQS